MAELKSAMGVTVKLAAARVALRNFLDELRNFLDDAGWA